MTIQVVNPRPTPDGFDIAVNGPPGVYVLVSSEDLVAWSELGEATNTLGAARFFDTTSSEVPHRFYRALKPAAAGNH